MEKHPLPASFWPKALLSGFANDCIYHVVVPSVFVTLPPWELLLSLPPSGGDDDPEVSAAHADFEFCSSCRSSQRGKVVYLGLRFLLARRKAQRVPDDGKTYWMYRSAFTDACICVTCASTTHGIVAHVDSGSDMFHLIMDVIEQHDDTQRVELSFTPSGAALSGPEYWARLIQLFRATRELTTSVPRALCRMDPRCNQCLRPDDALAMLVCSGCRYVRYCNRACSVAAWPQHKHACKRLKAGDLFYTDKAIEVLE